MQDQRRRAGEDRNLGRTKGRRRRRRVEEGKSKECLKSSLLSWGGNSGKAEIKERSSKEGTAEPRRDGRWSACGHVVKSVFCVFVGWDAFFLSHSNLDCFCFRNSSIYPSSILFSVMTILFLSIPRHHSTTNKTKSFEIQVRNGMTTIQFKFENAEH